MHMFAPVKFVADPGEHSLHLVKNAFVALA